ncbi:methane monooxygenase [Paraconexibacter algicola]|uniref:propane 2-monooxygenase n=1 Tax=Paraconexibacter algicola TaxID=2133960 RepID=A0A2T4UJZ0_9ACTN|nr:methane monooxygenase [Paraconexibacter algicola]PTL59566.1 methane monooxygenase [Paraconexibacter algicola]
MSATKRRSITKTHERIAQLGWDATYHDPVARYPTRYHIPAKSKDPMKQIMREYLPMELEKDDRVYGGHDAAVRAAMPEKVSERWLEVLKPFLCVTNYAEIGAGRCMSMLIDAIPSNELRNGYHVQYVDEVRHTGMQMALARWYTKHAPDPGGWNGLMSAMPRDIFTLGGMNFVNHFMVGDPIQCAFALQVVAETAFTNVAFVALPDVAARNGDFTLPTTYLSVQSDEARHISNGYATLLTVLQDDRNVPFIERDLQQAWWINHAFLDVFSAIVMEYFSRDRSDPESFLDKWDRWIRDDWYRSYICKLGGMGLTLDPTIFERARERIVKGMHHKIAMLAFATWPMHFWRFDGLDEKDFEWFERKYPGWYDEYGFFWEAFRELSDPKDRSLLLSGLMSDAPPFCWTCTMPSVIDEDICHRVVDDRTRFYCSRECRWMDESNPGRYTGDRNYFDRYHGMDIADVVQELGFVRPDGRTLTAQPHLRQDDKWTLDDLRAVGLTIESPNINTAKSMGLPSGDWSAAFKAGVNVATGRNGGPGPVKNASIDLPYPTAG